MSQKARLTSAKITYTPDGAKPIELAYQQNISISRSSEKKELLCNDNSIDGVVDEVETKISYNFKTEIADLSLDTLAICFNGAVEEKTYNVGDTFISGEVIKDTGSLKENDLFLHQNKLYFIKTSCQHSDFNPSKHALNPKGIDQALKLLHPEVKTANYGSLKVDGVNVATGERTLLIIPRINLSFSGDFAFSSNDYAKISLEGKILKVKDQPYFTMTDLK